MAFPFGMGRSAVSFYHSARPVSTSAGKTLSTETLPELCRKIVPPCNLNPLLFNGHLQTFWTATKNQDVPIYYRRKNFEAEDPAYMGTFAVDFVVDQHEETDESLPPRTVYFKDDMADGIVGSEDESPMVVVLHGLSGGSHELYLRHVLAPLVRKEGLPWKACVVNARGCAMAKVTSKILFNGRATWDLRQVAKWLRQKFPNRPLFGVGFSLGANILVNYLAEEGSDCFLKGAVVCSNPWNLDVSSVELQRTWLGREIYSKTMAINLKRLANIHKEQICRNIAIDWDKLMSTQYLHDFDRELQCPTWGYPTEGAYYRDASSVDSLLAVRIPLFAINSIDDPIAAKEAVPFEEFKCNPWTVLCTTATGGHLGWYESDGGRWFVKPMTGFLDAMAKVQGPFQDDETMFGSRQSPKPAVESATFHPVRRKLTVQPIELSGLKSIDSVE